MSDKPPINRRLMDDTLEAIRERSDLSVGWANVELASVQATKPPDVPVHVADALWRAFKDRIILLELLEPDRLAAAMNDAQVTASEIALGHDLAIPARRIAEALGRKGS